MPSVISNSSEEKLSIENLAERSARVNAKRINI